MVQLGWLVEELKQQLSLELDFRHEAANAAAMAAAFRSRPEVRLKPKTPQRSALGLFNPTVFQHNLNLHRRHCLFLHFQYVFVNSR